MSSNQRPDTLTQDRITNRRNLLAPHGRTIHMGHSRRFTTVECRPALPPKADMPTAAVQFGTKREDVSRVAIRERGSTTNAR